MVVRGDGALISAAMVRERPIETILSGPAASIVGATRNHADLRLGASPRGTLALMRGAQGLAYLRGRDFVTPDLVKTMVGPVLAHRLIIRPQAVAVGENSLAILQGILDRVPPPV